jgi:Sap, sulfolipid-1-addressing protein
MQKATIGAAILVGLIVFAPTPQYLAGVQVIATSEHRLAAVILLVLAAAIVNVAVVWIFLAAYLAAPARTKSHLARASTWVDWVKAHSELVIRTILAIVGVFLVISGAVGLSSS